jgi:SAM-dependent methyltransferase
VDRPLSLRDTFDEDAERYHRARPGYPDELFDDLAALTGLRADDRVLEIGPGTGQATVPLARRGYRIVAVELGASLAAVARRNLAAFPDVEVVTGAFEAWPLPPEPFDAVVSATAFHWIDPEVALARAAEALRPDGALAVVTTWHVAGGDEPFFAAVQDCYERFMPGTEPGERLRPAADVPTVEAGLEAGGRFAVAAIRRYERDIAYTTAEYLDLLGTYSGHIALAADARAALFGCIARLIDGRHGGRIVKRYLLELAVARARPRTHESPGVRPGSREGEAVARSAT